MEVALESCPCPLDCSSGDAYQLRSRDRVNGLPGEFQIVKCRGCGLLRTNPRPTPETIGYYYPESYAPYHLRKLHSWTRPGGWLAISVPNLTSLGFRAFKESWLHLHLPNHLFHYTPETVLRTLQTSGWQVQRLVYQRDISDLIGSLGNMMKDQQRFLTLAEKLATFPSWQGKLYLPLFPISWLLAAFGQTWAMTIWAKRNDD